MHLGFGSFRAVAAAALLLVSLPRESAAFNARLAWAAVSGASGYRLYVRTGTSAYGDGTDLGRLVPDADGIVRFLHTGLSASATHYFKVSSYDSAAESAPSNEIALPYAAIARILDSDGDGLTDAAEDVDLDAVTDANETDRLSADTDGDGVDDGSEIANGTNPRDPADPPSGAGPCARAVAVPAAGGTFSGTTSGASALRGSCGTADAPEKVYRWTPQTTGLATIETCSDTGTGFDTVLYLRRADCAGGQELGCNDDTSSCVTAEPSSYHGSRLAPMVTAGETYFIVVDGAGASGTFSLHVAAPEAPLSTATPPAMRPTPTSTPSRTATPKRTATATPRRTATATPARTATAVRTSTPVRTATAAGTATPQSTRTARPTRTPKPRRTPRTSGNLGSTPAPAPTGACASAGTIPASGGTVSGTTGSNMGHLIGSCAATRNSLEAVYRWTPTLSGVATISTCGSTFDTVLYVRTGDCLGGSELSCNNDSASCATAGGGRSTGSMLRLAVNAGETYFVVVDGRNGASGSYTLTVMTPAPTTSVALARSGDLDLATADAHPEDAGATIDLATTDTDAPYACRRWRRGEETNADGDTDAAATDRPRALCAPIAVGGGAAALVARYRIEDEPVPPSETIELRTALGDVAVEVRASALVEVPATTNGTPSVGSSGETPREPETCYDVRPVADVKGATLTITSAGASFRWRTGKPTRLCLPPAPADDDAAPLATRLCYRVRRSVGDGAAGAGESLTITSALGTATGTLGAVEEICLPAAAVADGL